HLPMMVRSHPWQRGCRSGPAMARHPLSHGGVNFSLLLSDPLPWMGHRSRCGVDNLAPALDKSVGHPGTLGLPLFFWVHLPIGLTRRGFVPFDVFDDFYDFCFCNEASFSALHGQVPHCGLSAPLALWPF